jgi:hypothetical protein
MNIYRYINIRYIIVYVYITIFLERRFFFQKREDIFFSAYPPWSRTVAGTCETGRGEGRTGEEPQGAAGFPVSTCNGVMKNGLKYGEILGRLRDSPSGDLLWDGICPLLPF